jgi:hypothetical protein
MDRSVETRAGLAPDLLISPQLDVNLIGGLLSISPQIDANLMGSLLTKGFGSRDDVSGAELGGEADSP